jgi:hypothetical protein
MDSSSPQFPPPTFPEAVPAMEAREAFSAGVALSRTLSVWSAGIPLYFGISLAAMLPLALLPTPDTIGKQSGLAIAQLLLTTPLWLTIQGVASGALQLAVVEELRGRRAELGRTLAAALKRLLPMLGQNLLTSLLVMLASLALVVPGLIFMVRWLLVAPVVVLEPGRNPRERSAMLTAGYRWSLFGLFLIVAVLGAAVGGILGFVAAAAFGPASMATRVAQLLSGALSLSISGPLYGVVYTMLRSEKEGADVEQIAAVFE